MGEAERTLDNELKQKVLNFKPSTNAQKDVSATIGEQEAKEALKLERLKHKKKLKEYNGVRIADTIVVILLRVSILLVFTPFFFPALGLLSAVLIALGLTTIPWTLGFLLFITREGTEKVKQEAKSSELTLAQVRAYEKLREARSVYGSILSNDDPRPNQFHGTTKKEIRDAKKRIDDIAELLNDQNQYLKSGDPDKRFTVQAESLIKEASVRLDRIKGILTSDKNEERSDQSVKKIPEYFREVSKKLYLAQMLILCMDSRRGLSMSYLRESQGISKYIDIGKDNNPVTFLVRDNEPFFYALGHDGLCGEISDLRDNKKSDVDQQKEDRVESSEVELTEKLESVYDDKDRGTGKNSV